MERWLTASDYALAAGISVQAARQHFRAGRGFGVSIATRVLHGRGGLSGKTTEAALSSLPEALQRAFAELHGNHCHDHDTTAIVAVAPPAGPRLLPAKSQGKRIERLLAAITPALLHPRGSTERAIALHAAVAPGMALRTLQRFVTEYEEGDYDLSLLGRRRPSDAGQRRVQVSRQFDKAYLAAGHDPAQLTHWGARRDQLLIDWWASPAQRGKWTRVKLEVETSLRRELADAGVTMRKADVYLSQSAVLGASHYREVDEYRHNRKPWDDGKSRIRRDNSLWKPMQEVVLDVKHLDNIVTRPDGSTVHPKMIGFLDSGTKRMFVHFVFPTKEERGVRQEHVIAAFIAMVTDPEWGLPERIYMDNGSENYKLETVQPLLDMIATSSCKTIVKAKPYSGASKPIESRFAQLDTQVFSQMHGYVGGDRMKARRPDLGKKTRPYPHSYDCFEQEARMLLADFEDQAIKTGPFAGRSPREIFVASCHEPKRIDPLALDAHFAEFIERQVDRGAVSINGTRYRRDDLPNGRKVSIALSYRRDAAPLVKVPGGDWAYLEAEQYYVPGMSDGAHAAARAQSMDRRRVGTMRAQARPVDRAGNLAARASERVIALPGRAAAAPFMDVIGSQQAGELAAARQAGEVARLAAPSADAARVTLVR